MGAHWSAATSTLVQTLDANLYDWIIMPITPEALADIPHLRLKVIAGHSGGGAEISWAHSSDHPHPEQWLTGGELVLRNAFTLPRDAVDQADLIDRLAKVGASGLVVGLDPALPAPDDALLDAANEHGLALLTTPYSASFVAIERAVGELVLREGEAGRLASIERIYQAVSGALAVEAGGDAIRALGRATSCRLAVVDGAQLTPVFGSADALAPDLRSQIRAEVERYGGTIPGVLHLPNGRNRAWVTDVPAGEPTLLVVHAPTGRAPELPVLQHLATAVAVLLTEQARGLEHDRRVGAELFASMVAGHVSAAIAQRAMLAHGLDPASTVIHAIDGMTGPDGARLHLAFERQGLPRLIMPRSDALLILAPDHEGAVTALLRSRLGPDVALGASRSLHETARMADAVREAMWAMQIARDVPGRTVAYREAPLLSGIRGPDEARALIDRVLGPALAKDEAKGSELVSTLRAFLAANRSWQGTAAALNVHRQTVVYRIDQIQRLSGLDLKQTGDLALCWLALRALDSVTESHSQLPSSTSFGFTPS